MAIETNEPRGATVEPTSRRAEANGINLHYWDWESSGPAIVMLHPSGSFGRVWDWVAADLNPEYRVIALDQRGHGGSDRATGNAAEDYAADLEALAAQLGLARFALVGHSLGGRVAIAYTAQHPERVSHLILSSGPHYSSLEQGADRQWWLDTAARMRSRPRQFPSATAARDFMRAGTPYLADAAFDLQIRHNMRHNPDGSVEWKADTSFVADGLAHALDDLTGYVRQITCPVLIIRAEQSWELTPERMPKVEALFPTSRTVTIPNSVIMLQLEKPHEVAAEIKEFVAASIPAR